MPAGKDPIYYALKPFKYLFLFSTTASSLGPTDLLVSSVWYRCYLVLLCTLSTFLLLYVVLNKGLVTLSPFNITSLYLYYWTVQFALVISPLMNSKKMRVQKILREFEDLDSKIRFRYSEEVEKSRTTAIVTITAAFVYHAVVHDLIVNLWTVSGFDSYIITLSYWFKVLEVGIDVELLCLGSLLFLLCHRCDYFASHLIDLLENRVDDTDLNLLLCHRQLHYVLKKINKAFKVKITIIVYFVTIFSLRNLVLVLSWHYEEKLLIYADMILLFRYILLLAALGAIGQRTANAFDRIHLLATNIRISSQINNDIRRRGADMCVEGELRGKRLCGCGGLVVDAKLPLRALSALGTILVFIFSIRIDMSTI